MVFRDKAKCRFSCTVSNPKDGRAFEMALAPDSHVTMLSLDTACAYLGCNQARVLDLMADNNNGQEFETLFGNKYKAYPFYLDTVEVWRIDVKRFYFWIGGNLRQSLLGFDFIEHCRFHYAMQSSSIILDGFNNCPYDIDHEDMDKIAMKLELHPDIGEPLAWFSTLDPARWAELQKLSPYLYERFQSGVFLTKDRDLYNHCREQMGFAI